MTLNVDKELIRVFTGITDPSVMKEFFNEIFTEAERKDLALRWELMRMLQDKVPQREIAATLGISLCKITRGVKVLKKKKSMCKQLLEKSSNASDNTHKTGEQL